MSRAAVLGVSLLAATAYADEPPLPTVVAVRLGEVDIAPVGFSAIGRGVSFKRSELLGTVVRQSGSVTTVQLPLDERVSIGEPASVAARDGGGIRIHPPRLGNLLSLSSEVGAFAGFDSSAAGPRPGASGFQLLGRLAAEYRFEFPLAIRATLSHAALSFVSPTNIAAIDASAGLSFDTRSAEIGLSAGAMTLNDATFPNGASAFTLTPLLRLGAIDGVGFVGTVQTVVVNGRPGFGGAFGAFAFPILDRYWLLLRAGGSRDGFAHTDLAVRTLVRGNGDHGSVFLLFFAGVAFSFFEQAVEDVIGPGGGFGIEFRP